MTGRGMSVRRLAPEPNRPATFTPRTCTLAEAGIEHHGRSQSADELWNPPIDQGVTVCDHAAENCPVWLGPGNKVYFGFPDPIRVIGTGEGHLAAFRAARDAVARKMPESLRRFTCPNHMAPATGSATWPPACQ
jgi:arsenate reductase